MDKTHKEKAISVSKLNNYIKNIINDDYYLKNVYVKGEIQRVNYHSSGHIYFDIKDDKSSISCIIYKNNVENIPFVLEQGMQVVIFGNVNCYEIRGELTLLVYEIEELGVGILYKKFLELKNELEELGMFSQIYKKPIKKYINTLGIVTSPNMAAINDIINTVKNKNPYIKIILSPSLVQGDKAKFEIPKAINRLKKYKPDTIILARGGGSIEDLWAFNEREVIDAIFNCEIPIITGIGHEIDITLADYVSDAYTITPTAAADLAVYDYFEFEEKLKQIKLDNKNILYNKIISYKNTVNNFDKYIQLNKPSEKIKMYKDKLYYSRNNIENKITEKKNFFKIKVKSFIDNNYNSIINCINNTKYDLKVVCAKIDKLSPINKLKSGYSYVTINNKTLTKISQVKKNSQINIRVTDGEIISNVISKSKIKENNDGK